jgi:hypothetical protein
MIHNWGKTPPPKVTLLVTISQADIRDTPIEAKVDCHANSVSGRFAFDGGGIFSHLLRAENGHFC